MMAPVNRDAGTGRRWSTVWVVGGVITGVAILALILPVSLEPKSVPKNSGPSSSPSVSSHHPSAMPTTTTTESPTGPPTLAPVPPTELPATSSPRGTPSPNFKPLLSTTNALNASDVFQGLGSLTRINSCLLFGAIGFWAGHHLVHSVFQEKWVWKWV